MKPSLRLLFAFWPAGPFCAFSQGQDFTHVEAPTKLSERVYSYWTIFLHPRSGYELPVPPGVRSVGVPEAATQTKFVSPDGSFVMSAWGGLSPQSPESVIDALWTRARSRPGRTVTYQQKAGTWCVVSGTDRAGTEFYEKFIMRGNHVAACILTYPRSRLREFEPWVEEIEDAFRVVAPPDAASEIVPARLLGTYRSEADPSTSPDPSREFIPTFQRSGPTDTGSLSPIRSPTLTAPRKLPELTIDLTPPSKTNSPEFAPTKLEGEGPSVSEVKSPLTKPVEATPPAQDLPVGKKVDGKPGFVYSPFYSENSIVDAEGIAPGTKVKCPYTGKIFRVP